MARYGGQAANFTADDLTQSPGEEDLDLTELMTKLTSNDSETEPLISPTIPNEISENGDNIENSASSFYKTKGVSNYDISNALYGTKDEDNPTINEEVGGKYLRFLIFKIEVDNGLNRIFII